MSRYRRDPDNANDLHMIEGDRAFARMDTRTRKNLLPEGSLAMSYNGRMETDGAWQARRGLQSISATLAVGVEALTLPFFAYANETASAIDLTGDVITLTFAAAHGFFVDTLVGISGIAGLTPDANGNRLLTAVTSTTISFEVAGVTGTASGTAVAGAPLLDDNAVNAVFGSAVFSDPNRASGEYIVTATNNKAILTDLATAAQTDILYPGTELVTERCELLQAFNKLYLFRAGKVPLVWDGDLTGTPAFAKVPSGTYTQPVELKDAAATISAAGKVELAVTAHGLSSGELVTVLECAEDETLEGRRFRVTVDSANAFHFFANAQTASAGTIAVRKDVAIGGGFSHMPAPPWAVYFQRRLIAPYHYTVDSSPDSYTDREIRDELIVSDILDGDTWDPIYAQYRITAGIADEIVAVEPFTNDTLLILNRNSLHLAGGFAGGIANTFVNELTREAGCIARKSIQRVGALVIFLSDNGVYAVGFGDEYNLRGIELPLSEPIQDQLARINRATANTAVSAYFANRYWLALPMGNASEPNRLFIYNFLNQGWESIDEVRSSAWRYQDLLVARVGRVNNGYAVNNLGGIHQLESRQDGVDVVGVSPGGALPLQVYSAASLTTRQYDLNNIERNRFTRFEGQIVADALNPTDAGFTALIQDPDRELPLRTLADYNRGAPLPAGQDIHVRGAIRARGVGCQIKFQADGGRPSVRALLVEGSITGRATASES
jgi:hypothetical protein